MEKRILLPTDFSNNSWNALLYAIKLFENNSCEFYILHTYTKEAHGLDNTTLLDPEEGFNKMSESNSKQGLGEILMRLSELENTKKHRFHVVSESSLLLNAIKKLNANVSFCFGRTISEGNDFWALYHNSVHQTRVQSQNVMSLTTACFLVDRKKLLDAGGFSEEYKHYGFEDKDLVATLLDTYGSSSISVNEDLVAVHNDKQTVSSVAKKFKLSAEYSAKIFNSRFPKFYSQLSYASFDARCISKLRNSLFLLTSPCVLVLTSPIQFLVNSNVIPFSVKKKLVQLICAMAYYSGSKAD